MSNTHNHRGLSEAEVAESRRNHGVNVLTPPARTPLWKLFLEKFRDPLIIVLHCAGALSVAISLYEYYYLDEGGAVFFEPAGIFIAIILATGLGFLLELKADREFAILNKVNDDEPVQVVRDGHVVEIPRRDVVVGDVVILNTGAEIPADGTLLESVTLNVDESTLTGEPICHKDADTSRNDPEATFPTNRVLRGTKVMEGHGVMEVDAVGDATENGKVYTAAQIDNSVRTPLNRQLDKLGRLITRFSYIIGIAVVVGRVLMYFLHDPTFNWMEFGAYFLQTIMIAVTLVVCSVPEGLPMAVTLSLAYSMRRMLRSNNLVRRMHACETMGATTVICTDKTGTLTQNQMRVYEADFYGHPSEDLIALGMAVNSTAELDMADKTAPKAIGNPTEGALLLWMNGKGYDYSSLRDSATAVAEVPFSTERKYMATEVRTADGRDLLFVKGAPEIVFGMCARRPEGVDPQTIEATLLKYQNQGMRTLGFAWQELHDGSTVVADGKLVGTDLEFLGIVAISDPVRSDVPAAVGEVLDAGIDIKIVTGDTPATAREIGRQIGLWKDSDTDSEIVTGPDFAEIPDKELPERVKSIKIIARARPLDKKRLVEALQADGEVVAVTGDGTNDAPALKAAQVGLSMGDGTSVAKEASDITIIDNSFASIGRAVMWGRSLYRNIQRFILFQITVNIVACVTVLGGAFMGLQSPLTVIQILWVNLIMDTFAAMALASLPPTSSVMAEKPRRQSDFIISHSMWRFILGCGVIFSILLMGLLYYMQHTEITSLTQIGSAPWVSAKSELSAYELSLFFTIFVFLQFWNLFNARAFATGRSAFHFKDCGGFLSIVAVIAVGQILIVTFGGEWFNVVPLRISDWCIIIGATSLVLWLGEVWRVAVGRHSFGS